MTNMNKTSISSWLLCKAYLVKALLLFRVRIYQYSVCIFESANFLEINICNDTTWKIFQSPTVCLLSIYIH